MIFDDVLLALFIDKKLFQEEGGEDKIHEEDRVKVKALIVDSMLVAPALIQKQLSDAVSIIGKSDFPSKWPGLLQNMVEKFATGITYWFTPKTHEVKLTTIFWFQ